MRKNIAIWNSKVRMSNIFLLKICLGGIVKNGV